MLNIMSNSPGHSDITDFFLEDAGEHLHNINDDLLTLENNQDELGLVDKIFRSIHAIKGSAGMAGFHVTSQLAHKIEDLLGQMRSQELPVSSEIIDLLFQGIDALTHEVDNIADDEDEDESLLSIFIDLRDDFLKLPFAKAAPQISAPAAKPTPSLPKPSPQAQKLKAPVSQAKPSASPPKSSPQVPKARPSVSQTKPSIAPLKPPVSPTKPPSARSKPPASPLQKPVARTTSSLAPTPSSDVALKPSLAPLELADHLIRQEQVEKAVAVYQKLLRDDPDNAMIRQRLAETKALHAYLQKIAA